MKVRNLLPLCWVMDLFALNFEEKFGVTYCFGLVPVLVTPSYLVYSLGQRARLPN